MSGAVPELPILTAGPATPDEFVAFWAPFYRYPNEHEYLDHIGTLTADALLALFRWKAGPRFSKRAVLYVRDAVLPRLTELRGLHQQTGAGEFLDRFGDGGLIWRVFLLHCWCPSRFPIFDQHVWRAYAVIHGKRDYDLGGKASSWQRARYIEDYLPWWASFHGEHDPVDRDRALWAFGKLCKPSSASLFDIRAVLNRR